jgi:large subunit ribosomal protein L25
MAKMKQEKLTLTAIKREIVGKRVRKLRREGKLPANVYGEDFASQAITIDKVEFTKLFRHAGETHVIYVSLDAEEIPVLVHNIQVHPVNHEILHIDLRKVNLKKKIEAQVPVHFVGESEAVAKGGGVMLTLADTVTVEALPDKLPDHVEIDLTKLIEINAEVKVSDLPKSADFEYKDEPEKVIVRITEHKEEELAPQIETPETPAVEGEVPAEGAETAAGEGAEEAHAAEGETKADEKSAEPAEKSDKPETNS